MFPTINELVRVNDSLKDNEFLLVRPSIEPQATEFLLIQYPDGFREQPQRTISFYQIVSHFKLKQAKLPAIQLEVLIEFMIKKLREFEKQQEESLKNNKK